MKLYPAPQTTREISRQTYGTNRYDKCKDVRYIDVGIRTNHKHLKHMVMRTDQETEFGHLVGH